MLACYWSIVVCYWSISQSQTTTQLGGEKAALHKVQQHKRTLVQPPFPALLNKEHLADHVVEGRHDPVHGDGVVTHAQDPVKLGGHEGHAGLGERLGERLLLDVHPAEGDGVRGQEPGQTAGPVPYLEISPVLLNIFGQFRVKHG